MELNLQIQETLTYLDDNKKRLILEIMQNFIPDDEVFPGDKQAIAQAEAELESGKIASWDDIKWK